MRGTVHTAIHDERRHFNFTQAICHTPFRDGYQRSDHRIQIESRSYTNAEFVERIVLAIHESSRSKSADKCLDAVQFERRDCLVEGLKVLRQLAG